MNKRDKRKLEYLQRQVVNLAAVRLAIQSLDNPTQNKLLALFEQAILLGEARGGVMALEDVADASDILLPGWD